jgi:hypothetical protein
MHRLPVAPVILLIALLIGGCLFGPPRWVTHPEGVRIERGIVFAEVDGDPLKLDLYVPEKAAGKLPALVWIFGGGWRVGDRGKIVVAPIATRGYVVASIDYRLSGKAKFPAQIHDCKAAIRFLRANAERFNIDPRRIGVCGPSAGGHLAALLGSGNDESRLEGEVGTTGRSSPSWRRSRVRSPTSAGTIRPSCSSTAKRTRSCPRRRASSCTRSCAPRACIPSCTCSRTRAMATPSSAARTSSVGSTSSSTAA